LGGVGPFVSFRPDEVHAAFTRVGVHIRIKTV